MILLREEWCFSSLLGIESNTSVGFVIVCVGRLIDIYENMRSAFGNSMSFSLAVVGLIYLCVDKRRQFLDEEFQKMGATWIVFSLL